MIGFFVFNAESCYANQGWPAASYCIAHASPELVIPTSASRKLELQVWNTTFSTCNHSEFWTLSESFIGFINSLIYMKHPLVTKYTLIFVPSSNKSLPMFPDP